MVVLLIPELGAKWSSIGVIVVYCGGFVLLVQIVRDKGKELQKRLYRSWGGKPSAAMLRHADSRLPKPTKNRYRSFLSRAVPGLVLASPQEEKTNPELADAGYDSANSWLLVHTRGRPQFDLLFTENMNYGFRRNLLALKPIALRINALALIFIIGMAVVSGTGEISSKVQDLSLEWWVSVVIIVVHTFIFLKYIQADWVLKAAETYARQLLAACDSLEGAIHT